MTNLEAYKEIIKEYVKETGELTCAVAKLRDFPLKNCNYIACSDCKQFMIDWLSEEHIEPIELTKVQIEILNTFKKMGASKIVLSHGKIVIHKSNIDAICSALGIEFITGICTEKSSYIDDILKNCVVKKDGN